MKLLKPTIDLVFKLLLTKRRKHLRSMLEAVLDEKIASFTLIDPQIPGELLNKKGIVIDVRVRLASGKHLLVEMQVRVHPALEARLLYYMARDYADQLGSGRAYQDLKPTVVIVWLVEPLFPTQGLHSVFEFRERTSHEIFSDHLTVHVLQLSKMDEKSSEPLTRLERRLRLWARFLASSSDEELEQLAKEDLTMASAVEILQHLSSDPEVARWARQREHDIASYERDLLDATAKAMAEGMAKGMAEGKAEGKAELLSTQLRTRFGELPKAIEARLLRATDDEFRIWSQRVLTATSLDAVFDA